MVYLLVYITLYSYVLECPKKKKEKKIIIIIPVPRGPNLTKAIRDPIL